MLRWLALLMPAALRDKGFFLFGGEVLFTGRLRSVHAAQVLNEEVFAVEAFVLLLNVSCAVVGVGSFGEVEGGRSSTEIAVAYVAPVGA